MYVVEHGVQYADAAPHQKTGDTGEKTVELFNNQMVKSGEHRGAAGYLISGYEPSKSFK